MVQGKTLGRRSEQGIRRDTRVMVTSETAVKRAMQDGMALRGKEWQRFGIIPEEFNLVSDEM